MIKQALTFEFPDLSPLPDCEVYIHSEATYLFPAPLPVVSNMLIWMSLQLGDWGPSSRKQELLSSTLWSSGILLLFHSIGQSNSEPHPHSSREAEPTSWPKAHGHTQRWEEVLATISGDSSWGLVLFCLLLGLWPWMYNLEDETSSSMTLKQQWSTLSDC